MPEYNAKATFSAIDNISGVVDNMGSAIAGFGDKASAQLSQMAANSDGLGGAFLNLAAGAIGPLTTALGLVFDNLNQLQEGAAKFQAQTGATAESVALFKKDSEGLFGTGLVNNLKDAEKIAGEVNKRFGDMDAPASQFEKDIAAVASAWDTNGGKMVDKIADITNKFSDLGGQPQKVLDALVQMAQTSGQPVDEITSRVDKFGTKLASAGLDGWAAMGLISAAMDNGVTSDAMGKLTAGVQKFHDQIINPPAGFQAAMDKLGLGDVAKQVQQNKMPMDEALNDVFEKISAIKTPAEQAQIFTALFGKAAEGAVTPEILGNMQGFSHWLDASKGSADKVASTLSDDGTLGTALKRLANNAIGTISSRLDETYQKLSGLDWGGAWAGLQGMAQEKLAGLQQAWDNVFGEKGIASQALAAVGKLITDLRTDFDNMVKGLTEALSGVGRIIVHPFAEGMRWLGQLIKDIGDKVSGLGGVFGQLSDAGASIIGAADRLEGHAWGGSLGEGWNMVGENGPELIFKAGGQAQVFSSGTTKQMMGAGAGGNPAGAPQITISGNTFIGAGGMSELGRVITQALQQEQQRRGIQQTS